MQQLDTPDKLQPRISSVQISGGQASETVSPGI